jgi:hypothetical protein
MNVKIFSMIKMCGCCCSIYCGCIHAGEVDERCNMEADRIEKEGP